MFFRDSAYQVNETTYPSALSPEFPYIGLEHIEQETLQLIRIGNASKVTSNKRIFKKGDILFGKLRPYFRKVIIADFDGICSTDIWVIRPKENIDSKFLYYWCADWKFINFINSASEGTRMPRAKWEVAINHEIPNHTYENQKKIGNILASLDKKIELNKKNNETLEGIAKSLFKSWFIDFDPVTAKSEGRSTGLPDEISDLFPDSFEDSELGKTPYGWKYCLSSDLYDISIGKTPPRKESCWFSQSEDDIPWVSIKDMGSNKVYALQTSEFLTKDAIYNFNIKVVPEGTVIISFKLTVGRVLITPTKMLTNEAIAHFVSCKNQIPSSYSYCLFSNFDFRSLGSTSSIANAVNSKMLRGMKILEPPHECKQAFDHVCNPLFQKIKQSLNESKVLEEIRDFLLPKLISGELRIPDAEKMIDEVGI